MKRFIIAITGSSAPILGVRLMEEVVKTSELHVVISSSAFQIINMEIGSDWSENSEEKIRERLFSDRVHFYNETKLDAPISSGSFITDGMFVVPCSVKTLSAIASGYAGNLIERAADVTIKEGRTLILSPRETPFSAIHLENMLKLARIGVKIIPPNIAFYHKPKSPEDIIDFITGKILDGMSIPHDLFHRWGV